MLIMFLACDYYDIVGLMGLFEKRRYRNFLVWVQNYDEENQDTWKGFSPDSKVPMHAVYEKFGLDGNTQDVTGHAFALHLNDE